MEATRREFLKGLGALVAAIGVPALVDVVYPSSPIRAITAASFASDGFIVGDVVEWRGAKSEGVYRIVAVTATEITISG